MYRRKTQKVQVGTTAGTTTLSVSVVVTILVLRARSTAAVPNLIDMMFV